MNRDVCEHFNPVDQPCRKCAAKPQTTHWQGCEEVHPECRKSEPPCKTGASCTNKCPRCAEPEQKAWFTVPELNEWADKLKEKNNG